MKATVTIDLSTPQGQQYLMYTRTLPFAEVVEEQEMSFEEAARACNAITVDEFVHEAKRQIREH